jgi:hypothetical protein
MGHALMGRISNRYRYPTLDELKCPILILQGFNPQNPFCEQVFPEQLLHDDLI